MMTYEGKYEVFNLEKIKTYHLSGILKLCLEPDNMRWAVETIESVTNGKIPLSIDSSYPKTIITGIENVKNKKGLLLNSITLDESRHKELIPIAKEYDLNIIALPIDKNGIPDNADKRLCLALKIAEHIKDNGISSGKLYIDCIIEPISISPKNALVSLDTISEVKKNIPEAKKIWSKKLHCNLI